MQAELAIWWGNCYPSLADDAVPLRDGTVNQCFSFISLLSYFIILYGFDLKVKAGHSSCSKTGFGTPCEVLLMVSSHLSR